MGFRTINISKPCKISIRNLNFLFSPEDGESISVPMSDIAVIILETNKIIVTASLLSKLADNNILLFSCDSSHIPNGIFLPFHQHCKFSLISHLQKDWTLPFKKKLWQSIISQKIYNHSLVLKYFSKEKEHKELFLLSKGVKSGDSSNIEGYAAKVYWSYLFENFNRRDISDWRNNALNYGYSIIRRAIARSVSASGLLPTFGLHHHSQFNAFNLIDDLIEPYRAIIEKEVNSMLCSFSIIPSHNSLTKEHRVKLLEVLQHEIIINKNKTNVLNSIEVFVSSLVRSTTEKKNFLLCPILIVQKYES